LRAGCGATARSAHEAGKHRAGAGEGRDALASVPLGTRRRTPRRTYTPAMKSNTRDLLEYGIFAAPCWLAPVISVIGLLWLAGNKSQWDRLPFAIAFLVGTLCGLIALSVVLMRRMRGQFAIGTIGAFFLLVGLVTCVAPWWRFQFLSPYGPAHSAGDGQLTMVLLFLWPAPIYLHWLVAGVLHRFKG
jgi:hypothetical protein